MKPLHLSRPQAGLGATLLALSSSALQAQGVGTDAQLAPVTLTGAAVRSGLAANLPSNSASVTAEELREQNLINPEDALRYLPNTSIRKRYIGDRNALIGGRSFGTLQPGRGLAYVDGYLISNFLGRFDAPRWNVITPEAIARVDMLYGPFSAIYPGNSIGTTVVTTEREPRRLEASARLSGHSQRFELYGFSERYGGYQFSSYVGTRLDSGLWLSAAYNRQDSESQPMNYYTLGVNAKTGSFDPARPTDKRVSGITYDTDPLGQPRAILGAGSGAVDHTRQDTLKLKAGLPLGERWVASGMLALWTNNTENSNRSFLRDAAGATVWSGRVTDGQYSFDVPDGSKGAAAFAPSEREERHRHAGLTLKTRGPAEWNGSLVYSNYRILSDLSRQANLAEDQARQGGPGVWTYRDGTGWNTLEAQAVYRPKDSPHAWVLGLHRNAYVLDSPSYQAPDWRSTLGALSQRYQGRTEVRAAYVQDSWQLHPDWRLTSGLRQEWFRSTDGLQLLRLRAADCKPGASTRCLPAPEGMADRVIPYEERRLSGASPKLSLAWQQDVETLLKLSFGRGVRFPNVEELYNGTLTPNSETTSDPTLRAERSNAWELSGEKDWGARRLRLSLFLDDVRDAILRQSDNSGGVTRNRVSNVDRVRTYGVEAVWQADDLFVKGLGLDLNAAWARSRVLANPRDPQSEGKTWPRIPTLRANARLVYRPDAQWMGSLGLRHSGRAYNDPYNRDVNPEVYGAVSSFTLLDLRLSRQLGQGLELAVGVDNVGNRRAFQAHPYPGRTLFTELRASL